MKIVFAEKTSPAALELFREETRWKVITPEQINGKLPEAIADAEALIVRSAVQVDAGLLESASKLRVIGRAGIGVDNIDLDAATRKGIAVMNTPGANAVAVAEHALALMLAMARQIPRANSSMHAGRWEKKSLQGWELRGKTLGIIGLGRIGMEVAKRALAFGMEIVAHDPFVSAGAVRSLGIKLADRDQVFATADYLSLHVGLSPQTAGMINAAALASMKRGVRIVNCARGELIDELALAQGIKAGQVSGAALDVFTQEPPKDSPLVELENVILTPHIAGSTYEAQEAVGYQIALQVKEYLKRGVIQNAVNVPSVSHDEYIEMQPYIVLAERLGAFLAQAIEGTLEEISLRYSGSIAEWRTELIRNAGITGILSNLPSERTAANLVNAMSLAEERGVRVNENKKSQTPSGGAANVISMMLKRSSGEMLVKGAVLHGSSPRLLAVDDIDIEAPLEGCVIYLRNRDVPGVIGRVGTILGQRSINIANFALGRAAGKEAGRSAIAVVQVDSSVSEDALNELRRVDAITLAKAIKF
jgi:D-3-phosphoglycerate dehydrogenase / 2-oxoglutarate reductase